MIELVLVYLGRQPDVLEAVCHGGVGGVEGGGVARGVGQGAHRRGGQLSPDKKEAELSKLCARNLLWSKLSSLSYLECIAVATASTWVTSGLLSGSGVMQSATTDL